jgi:hypothetical protein
MKRLPLIATFALLAACTACTFSPDLGDNYFACRPDGTCPGECQCLNGQLCIPPQDQDTNDCAWCPEGEKVCYDPDNPDKRGVCARILVDPDHCGESCKACPEGFVCEYGACVERCREGLIECERSCVDPQTDPQNCGRCGHACGRGRVCSLGNCERVCPENTENCYGACVDTSLDPAHCGECEVACRLSHATADCVESTCVVRGCLDCYRDCDQLDQTGCETCTESDPQNCGECGLACDNPPPPVCEENNLIIYLDIGECVSGECRYQSSLKPCAHGCESGACIDDPCLGVSCDLNMHCENGHCVCDHLYGDCDSSTLNGCETYLNDIENCGECDFYCGQNSVCVEGACDCKYGYGNCDDNWGDGCEEDLLHNNTHCGTCGLGCTFPNDTCCAGQCVDTNTDRGNCGRCNLFCSGMTECCLGVCTDTQMDPENCGSCGYTCTFPLDTCCWGHCVDVRIDPGNCGDCGAECATNIPCQEGTCGAQGIHCGDTTCDFWEELCCYGSAGIGCYPAGECAARIVECDDNSDCGDQLYCCLVDNTQYVTQCGYDCTSLVCSSAAYCAQNAPDKLHCCTSDFDGQLVNVCQAESCQ